MPDRVAANEAFSLGYNTDDSLILGKDKLDIEQCLMQVRFKVFYSNNGQIIGHVEAILDISH